MKKYQKPEAITLNIALQNTFLDTSGIQSDKQNEWGGGAKEFNFETDNENSEEEITWDYDSEWK